MNEIDSNWRKPRLRTIAQGKQSSIYIIGDYPWSVKGCLICEGFLNLIVSRIIPSNKTCKKPGFWVQEKELLTWSHVGRVVLRCKEGGSSQEFGAENYCLCYLYIRKILINRCYLKVKESSSVEIAIKSQWAKYIEF